MKYFIIILITILFILFIFNIQIRIYKHNNEKYNIDLTLTFFFKITIDVDEMFNKYLKNKTSIDILNDFKKTYIKIKQNQKPIIKSLKKIQINKIILILNIVPLDPITYSYVTFTNYQILNFIKRKIHELFKKVKKEDYIVTLVNNQYVDSINFDIVISLQLITLLNIIIRNLKLILNIRKENNYGTTSN